jgi:hypothetical protein
MEKFRFEAITKGLGFHDTLEKSPKYTIPEVVDVKPRLGRMGTGAESAGAPKFWVPAPPQAHSNIAQPLEVLLKDGLQSTSAPNAPITSRPSTDPSRLSSATEYTPEAPFGSSLPSPLPSLDRSEEIRDFEFSYVVKRVTASLIDLFINSTLCTLLLSIPVLRLDFNPLEIFQAQNGQVGFLFAAFLFIVSWTLVTAQEVVLGTSLGKKMFRMKLEGGSVRIFSRAILYLLFLAPAGLGLITSLFDKKKRCLHDILSNLQPKALAKF